MLTVGIRELKTHTSEIMRRVRERGEVIDITFHGQVVARLVPAPPVSAPEETAAILADLDQLAAEISAAWPKDVSAPAAVRDARREL